MNRRRSFAIYLMSRLGLASHRVTNAGEKRRLAWDYAAFGRRNRRFSVIIANPPVEAQ